ncbi:MAG: hypothetical protein ABGX40_02790 [Methylococcales bacterium]|jgi:protein-S-isoprenylcysteine O-methyltransferase Ste14
MKPHIVSLLNAIVLISFGAWGYFGSESPSPTALIPVAIGVVLLLLNQGVKKENKVITHIVVFLTLLILIGLFKPLMGAVDRNSIISILRVSGMMLFTVLALITFIRNFINVRKLREMENKDPEGS